MNDEKVKNLQEFKQVRNAYKDNLKQRIKIDKITENANILYKFNKTLPHYIPDLMSNNQKASSINEMKAELIDALMKDGFTTQKIAENFVFDLPDSSIEEIIRQVPVMKENMKAKPVKLQEMVTFLQNNTNVSPIKLEDEDNNKITPTFMKKLSQKSLEELQDIAQRLGISTEHNGIPNQKGTLVRKIRLHIRDNNIDVIPSSMTGTGLCHVKKNKCTSKYSKLGTKLVNHVKLKNDYIVDIKYPCGVTVSKYPCRKVSRNVANILQKVILEQNPTYEELEQLKENERKYIHKILKFTKAKGHEIIPAPNKDDETAFYDRFQFLLGQISSGNNSKELIQELKVKLVYMRNENILPKAEINSILYDLLDLGY